MLGFWRNHAEYQQFMVGAVNREYKRNPKAVENYEVAILKMYHLNLDSIREDLLPLFSLIGRPSDQQPELLRSLILMSHFKYDGVDKWVKNASASPLLCALVGVKQDNFPGASTHRDFQERLWMADKPSRTRKPSAKPKGKHGKNKLPPKHSGIVAYLVEKALSGEVFKRIPERLLQSIFMKTAADGTCIQSHAFPNGHKTCGCKERCDCPRSFADPEAKWGWDSYHEQWFYGYTAYLLSVHNKELKLDLPVYLKFVDASRHDSVTLISALAHARYLYKSILNFDSLLADAAHDNYPTYDLLKQWHIKSFIDLNNRSDNKLQVDGLQLSRNNIPVCADGHEMVNWGFEKKKYRIKFRCPAICGKVKNCPYFHNCNNSLYGKSVYLRLASDLRLLTPVPRGSDDWMQTYKLRTASERVNNRILTDYQLEKPKRYGKAKLCFFAFWNAMNVHLDALVKFGEVSLQSLVA